MKIFKCVSNSQVSYYNSLRKAIASNPQVIFEQRGLIVRR